VRPLKQGGGRAAPAPLLTVLSPPPLLAPSCSHLRTPHRSPPPSPPACQPACGSTNAHTHSYPHHPPTLPSQDWDTLCQLEHLPLYNFHECISPVDATHARATDVVMGVSNPLYRRGMFGGDFLDIAKIVAKRKVRAMLAAHYAASGEALAPQDAAELAQDEGQLVRALALPLAVNSPAAQRAAGSSTRETPAEQKAHVLSPELLALGLAALRHPDLAETAHLLRWKRANPPDALFLVDDVYISAYMACKGVARLVVPSTPKARPPVPWAKGAASALPPQPPRPAVEAHDGSLASVDALHGVAHFNLGNHEAVRFFHQEGCW